MLILALNRSLQFWVYGNLNKIHTIEFQNPNPSNRLELHQTFQTFWENFVWPEIQTKKEQEILLIFGSKASFTDSRIITIWLNSLSLFYSNSNIKIAKYLDRANNPDDQNYLENLLPDILNKISWASSVNGDIYTRAPTIGTKTKVL